MNNRFTVQELIEALTQRHDMELADAEAFVHTFFKLIEERLESDRYVKIKGLGTFKLVNIDSRESIDVNTGKRIEIKSHNRIVFTPDSIMRNLVNKPFAHFETVQLNENTYFDDFDIFLSIILKFFLVLSLMKFISDLQFIVMTISVFSLIKP